MVVTTHQPIFLPWPGFFYKALQANALVLLDRVQFPQGRGWLHRNRLWGDFRYNGSTLDLVLNCGPRARDIILAGPP